MMPRATEQPFARNTKDKAQESRTTRQQSGKSMVLQLGKPKQFSAPPHMSGLVKPANELNTPTQCKETLPRRQPTQQQEQRLQLE